MSEIICVGCNGSGEGFAIGSECVSCGGSGVKVLICPRCGEEYAAEACRDPQCPHEDLVDPDMNSTWLVKCYEFDWGDDPLILVATMPLIDLVQKLGSEKESGGRIYIEEMTVRIRWLPQAAIEALPEWGS